MHNFWKLAEPRLKRLEENGVFTETERRLIKPGTYRRLMCTLHKRSQTIQQGPQSALFREVLFYLLLDAIQSQYFPFQYRSIPEMLFRTMHTRGRVLFAGRPIGSWQLAADHDAQTRLWTDPCAWDAIRQFEVEALFDPEQFNAEPFLALFYERR